MKRIVKYLLFFLLVAVRVQGSECAQRNQACEDFKNKMLIARHQNDFERKLDALGLVLKSVSSDHRLNKKDVFALSSQIINTLVIHLETELARLFVAWHENNKEQVGADPDELFQHRERGRELDKKIEQVSALLVATRKSAHARDNQKRKEFHLKLLIGGVSVATILTIALVGVLAFKGKDTAEGAPLDEVSLTNVSQPYYYRGSHGDRRVYQFKNAHAFQEFQTDAASELTALHAAVTHDPVADLNVILNGVAQISAVAQTDGLSHRSGDGGDVHAGNTSALNAGAASSALATVGGDRQNNGATDKPSDADEDEDEDVVTADKNVKILVVPTLDTTQQQATSVAAMDLPTLLEAASGLGDALEALSDVGDMSESCNGDEQAFPSPPGSGDDLPLLDVAAIADLADGAPAINGSMLVQDTQRGEKEKAAYFFNKLKNSSNVVLRLLPIIQQCHKTLGDCQELVKGTDCKEMNGNLSVFLHKIETILASTEQTHAQCYEELSELYALFSSLQANEGTPELELIKVCFVALDHLFSNAHNFKSFSRSISVLHLNLLAKKEQLGGQYATTEAQRVESRTKLQRFRNSRLGRWISRKKNKA